MICTIILQISTYIFCSHKDPVITLRYIKYVLLYTCFSVRKGFCLCYIFEISEIKMPVDLLLVLLVFVLIKSIFTFFHWKILNLRIIMNSLMNIKLWQEQFSTSPLFFLKNIKSYIYNFHQILKSFFSSFPEKQLQR